MPTESSAWNIRADPEKSRDPVEDDIVWGWSTNPWMRDSKTRRRKRVEALEASTIERHFNAKIAAEAEVGRWRDCHISNARLVPSGSFSRIPANATGSGDVEHHKVGFASETWMAAASSCSATRSMSNSPALIKQRSAEISCLAANSCGATKPFLVVSSSFWLSVLSCVSTISGVAGVARCCQYDSALLESNRAKGRAGTSPKPRGSMRRNISSTSPQVGPPCQGRFCAIRATSWVRGNVANIPKAANCSTSHPSSSAPMTSCNKSIAASTRADASRKRPFQRSKLTVVGPDFASLAKTSAWWGVNPSTVFNNAWQNSANSKVAGNLETDTSLSKPHSATKASKETPEATNHRVAAVEALSTCGCSSLPSLPGGSFNSTMGGGGGPNGAGKDVSLGSKMLQCWAEIFNLVT